MTTTRSMFRIGLAFVFVTTLSATAALTADVTFKCVLQNEAKGYAITVTSTYNFVKTCSAECEVTKADGSKVRFAKCGPKTVNGGVTEEFFCGEGLVKGNPVKDPMIVSSGCN